MPGQSKSDDDPIPASAWWMLAVLWILYVNSIFDRLILSLMVLPIKQDLGLSDVEMGIIIGPAFALVYAFFGWPLGWAADRLSRRWTIYLGATLWAVAVMCSGLSRSFGGLLGCRVFVGVGDAALTPASYSLMGDKFPKRRLTLAMSIFQSASMVGTSTAFLFGGLLVGFATSLGSMEFPVFGHLRPWQMVLIMAGAPSILLALLVFTFAEPKRTESRTVEGAADTDSFPRFVRAEWRLLLPMVIGFALVVTLSQSLMAWTPTFITRQFGWSADRYGAYLGAITAVGAMTMIAKGWIVDWLYARGMVDAHIRFFSWLVAAALPVSVGMFFVSNVYGFMVLYGIVQALIVQFVVYVAATIQLVTPSRLRAQMIGVFMSIFTVTGMGLGPLLTAAITDKVLADEARLGMSLAIMSLLCLPPAWLLLRLTMRQVRMKLSPVASSRMR